MDKRTKEVVQAQLNAESAVMKELEKVYRAALDAINERIRLLQTGEITQSTIYHIEYQKTLKAQVSAILDKLQADEYTSLEKYLTDNYNIGFAGAAYVMHGQSVPVLLPIDKNAVYKAIVADTKLTHPLYKEIGLDMTKLKKTVTQEISRGIATNLSYKEIARNIETAAKIPKDRAKAIARTDGHRVLEASAEDARQAAKARGADVLKQWDATMDGDTRDTHRQLDGQIRETNEPFTLGSKSAMYPGSFGIPEEDCNCRCIATTRARWELDEDELNILKERAAFFGLDKTNDFEEFKEKYLKASEDFPKENNSRKAAETLKKEGKSGIIDTSKNVIADAIKNGLVKTTVNRESQRRHMIDSPDYKTGRSYMYGTLEEINKLISELIGKGVAVLDRKGAWTHKERVQASKVVGKHIDKETGTETETHAAMIVYSNTGTHIYPRKEEDE